MEVLTFLFYEILNGSLTNIQYEKIKIKYYFVDFVNEIINNAYQFCIYKIWFSK